jgi:hypothetical protein
MQTLAKFFAKLYLKKIDRLEKRIGYRLVFPRFSDSWINGCVRVDLTKAWKRFGLDVTGIDYFTMGNLVGGVSTRFDPKARQYQSWIGGYLVKFNEARNWTVQDHFNLAVVDQTDWLRDYADPHPVCELHPSGFQEAGQVAVGAYTGKLYIGGGVSHSDVGNGRRGLRFKFITVSQAALFNLSNPTLCLTGRSFTPKTVSNSYHTLYLKGYIIIVDIEKDMQAVLYGNGAVFEDNNDKKIDTFALLKDELLDILTKIVIMKS